MSTNDVSPRNRAERRLAGKKARAAGAVLTAGSAALAMGAAWVGPGITTAGAATTLHVTSLADSGAGTLRDQIGAAVDGDTIVFDVTGTITLTTGDIPIVDDLTIAGPGASALTIDGNNADRIFTITGATVTISGLTFANGTANDGGAIDADSSSPLFISGSSFEDNTSSDDGGAINTDAAITVDSSSFIGNTANDWGGGILMVDATSGVVTNSVFQMNVAGGGGGGLAVDISDSITVANTTFDQNDADENGGGMITYQTRSTVTGSTFTGNEATENGGGAHFYHGDVGDDASVASSTFSGNTAGFYGGGISFEDLQGSASMDGVTVSGQNMALGEGGGGVAILGVGGAAIANSNISGNSTENWGGGIYATDIYGDLTVTNTTIAGNTAGSGGGGMQLWGDNVESGMSVTVTDTTISGNTATDAEGGGWLQWGVTGPTSFNNSTISGNTAADEGGGIYIYNSDTVSINMSTITQNTSGATTGGVFIQAQNISSAQSGKVKDKSARSNDGTSGSDDRPAPAPHESHAAGVHAAAVNEVNVTGTILWGNSGNDLGGEGFGSVASNVLGTVADTMLMTDAGGNLTGVDPLLGPLANNGGATQTHELLAGSPAINTGPDPVPSFAGNEFDQRGAGFPRVSGGTSDIGAFEVQPVNIAPRFTG